MDSVMAFTIFTLVLVVGFAIVNDLPIALHMSIMSGINAISGITVVGAIIAVRSGAGWLGGAIGLIAIISATANAVGGFAITYRMLDSIHKEG